MLEAKGSGTLPTKRENIFWEADVQQGRSSSRRARIRYRYTHLLLVLVGCFAFAFLRSNEYMIFAPLPSSAFSLRTTNAGINWTKCGKNLECGRLEVPLDYTNHTPGVVSLALIRYPVEDQSTRLGTILVNPGGPGGSGLSYVKKAGPSIQLLTGGRHDIVSWDPRGIGETEPPIRCFDTWNYSDPEAVATFTSHYRAAEARMQVAADLCHAKVGSVMPFVGTTSVVRDMDRIFRAIEGDDELVNYWGVSYGTAIGSYFVNMFPDRVGRFIIDGVLNPHLWANAYSYEYIEPSLHDIEKVLSNFLGGCAKAGPGRCPLASNSSTAASIAEDLNSFLQKLSRQPIPVSKASQPNIMTLGHVEAFMFAYMYKPREWSTLAEKLAAAMDGDPVPLLNAILPPFEINSGPADTPYSTNAVICADGPDHNASQAYLAHKTLETFIDIGRDLAPHFSPLMLKLLSCHQWAKYLPSSYRFTGPFNHTLNNVMLVIGNTADPVTPLVNAEFVNSLLPVSSRLVVQNGSGHCSVAQTSLCTVNIIRNYFLNGTLPEKGIICEIDEQLFPPSNEIDFQSGYENFSSEDIELFMATRNLADHIIPLGL